MSHHCPSCDFRFPFLRGVTAHYERQPTTRWWRFNSPRFFCRNCGVELRRTLRPLGYVLFVIWCIVPLTMMGIALVKVPSLSVYALIVLVACVPIGVYAESHCVRWAKAL